MAHEECLGQGLSLWLDLCRCEVSDKRVPELALLLDAKNNLTIIRRRDHVQTLGQDHHQVVRQVTARIDRTLDRVLGRETLVDGGQCA